MSTAYPMHPMTPIPGAVSDDARTSHVAVKKDRWDGITRNYTAEDVRRLRGSIRIEHTLARLGAERLWKLMTEDRPYVNALGAMSGNQAMQMVRAGLKAI